MTVGGSGFANKKNNLRTSNALAACDPDSGTEAGAPARPGRDPFHTLFYDQYLQNGPLAALKYPHHVSWCALAASLRRLVLRKLAGRHATGSAVLVPGHAMSLLSGCAETPQADPEKVWAATWVSLTCSWGVSVLRRTTMPWIGT